MTRANQLADAYGRYAALILDQLAAVEADDPAAFERLAGERDKLAGTIESIQKDLEPGANGFDSVLAQLEACLAADLKLRARLEALHAESRESARRLDANRAAIRSYAQPVAGKTRVDLSL